MLDLGPVTLEALFSKRTHAGITTEFYRAAEIELMVNWCDCNISDETYSTTHLKITNSSSCLSFVLELGQTCDVSPFLNYTCKIKT